MKEIVVNVAASLIAGAIVWLMRHQLATLINLMFSSVYPNISGVYEVTFDPSITMDKDIITIYELNQLGPFVSGRMYQQQGGKASDEARIKGRVSASRVVRFTCTAPNAQHNTHGTGLLLFGASGESMNGVVSYLCTSCQKAFSVDAVLEKV